MTETCYVCARQWTWFFLQAEDGIRDAYYLLEFRRWLFLSDRRACRGTRTARPSADSSPAPAEPAPRDRRTPCACRWRRRPDKCALSVVTGSSGKDGQHPCQRIGINRRVDGEPHA